MQSARADNLDRLFDVTLDLLCIADLDGHFLRVNKAWERTLGYSTDELVARRFFEFIHPDDLAITRDIMASLAAQRSVVDFTNRYRCKDGTYRWIEWRSVPVGNLIYAAARDVSGRRQSELDRIQLSILLESSLNEIYIFTPDTYRFEFVSRSALANLGYTMDEMRGMTPLDIKPDFDEPRFNALVSPLRAGDREKVVFQTRHRRADGTLYPVEVHLQLVDYGREKRFLAMIYDNSERKLAEDALADREYWLRESQRAGRIATYRLDVAADRWECTRVLEDIFGIPPDYPHTVASWIEIVHPEQRTEMNGYFRSEVLGGRAAFDREYRIRRPLDNQDRWVYGRGEIQLDERGEPAALIGTIQDITDRRRAEEAIRRSEEFLRQVIENASGVPFQLLFDDEFAAGRYTQVGAGIEQLFGVKPEDFHERFFASIVEETVPRTPGIPADPVECRRRMKAGEISHYRADVRVRLPDGRIRWVSDTSLPLRDETTGEVIGAMGILMDITERMNREEEVSRLNAELEERVRERTAQFIDANERLQREITGHRQAEERIRIFQQFADASGQGFGMATPDARVIYMNPTLCRMIGAKPDDEASWKAFPLYYPPEMRERLQQEAIPTALERGQWVGELALLDPQGGRIPTIENFFVIRDPAGGVAYLADVVTDITERKRNEEELKRNRDQLASANKELESFAYSVSHDLRAPLRGIDGWSQALLEDYGPGLDETARGYLETVRAETQRMARLIDALLRLSRVTRCEMKREAVDLTRLAQEVEAELRAEQPQRPVEFAIAPGLTAQGDGTLLLVLLRNLLHNAWKFTARRTPARIAFFRQVDGESAFVVQDNGAGFDMAHAGRLFAPFQRLHSPAEFSGTGIGLATVQHIVHRHGGRIWAEGRPDEGAVFFFTLP